MKVRLPNRIANCVALRIIICIATCVTSGSCVSRSNSGINAADVYGIGDRIASIESCEKNATLDCFGFLAVGRSKFEKCKKGGEAENNANQPRYAAALKKFCDTSGIKCLERKPWQSFGDFAGVREKEFSGGFWLFPRPIFPKLCNKQTNIFVSVNLKMLSSVEDESVFKRYMTIYQENKKTCQESKNVDSCWTVLDHQIKLLGILPNQQAREAETKKQIENFCKSPEAYCALSAKLDEAKKVRRSGKVVYDSEFEMCTLQQQNKSGLNCEPRYSVIAIPSKEDQTQ